jgi:hypothetical protein
VQYLPGGFLFVLTGELDNGRVPFFASYRAGLVDRHLRR